VNTEPEPEPPVEAPVTPRAGQFSQDKLQEIMQKIASGEAAVSLVKPHTVQRARSRSGRLPPRLRPTRLASMIAATGVDMPWSCDSSAAAAHDRSRVTAYGHRSDPHIGEASHPGPDSTTAHSSSLLAQGQPFGEYKGNRVERIVISLCDGLGGALLALNTVCAAMTRYIAVENHDTSRVICNNVNDGQGGTLTPDHTCMGKVGG
jgi:hypothetical protein